MAGTMNTGHADPETLYTKQNCIGGGSFGKVYKGVDKRTGQSVAIKIIDVENADDEDEDRTSQPSASADEVSTPAKKTKKVRKLKVDEAEREAEEEGGEEPVAPIVQEQQLEASSHDDAKLEPESDEQEESFFEAEMFHMQ